MSVSGPNGSSQLVGQMAFRGFCLRGLPRGVRRIHFGRGPGDGGNGGLLAFAYAFLEECNREKKPGSPFFVNPLGGPRQGPRERFLAPGPGGPGGRTNET